MHEFFLKCEKILNTHKIKFIKMKNIAKFYIFITAFSLTLSSNSLAQNEKRQMIKGFKKISNQDVKNYHKIADNDIEETDKIDRKFYLGVDAIFQNSSIRAKGINNPDEYYEPNTSAISVFAGYDNQDYFKIEGVYSKTNEKKQINATNSLLNIEYITKTMGVDFKPYLVFDKESRGLFYLILGVNYDQIEAKEFSQTKALVFPPVTGYETSTKSRNSSVSKVSPVIGVGVEYLFYKNFALRFQYKRNFVDAEIINSDFIDKVKVIENLGVGISHPF